MAFLDRVQRLPRLGLGVSTEYGAGDSPNSLDIGLLRRKEPKLASFLEIGLEVEKGLDRHALAWIQEALPTTYHFLDINLDEPEDFDPDWLQQVQKLCRQIRPAWLCGDAGLWHLGRRERGHMLLLPPILCAESLPAMRDGIQALRELTGLEVLPENPPGAVFVGKLHLLDFFARLAEISDTGLLLDCAHLAIYQHYRGLDPLDGLKDFPLERVVELHIAGRILHKKGGYTWIEDSHSPEIQRATMQIVEAVLERASNLKAVVCECERNPLRDILPLLKQVEQLLAQHPPPLPPPPRPAPEILLRPHIRPSRIQQQVLARLHNPKHLWSAALHIEERALLDQVPLPAWTVDAERPYRVLSALIEEFPVSVSLSSTKLEAFFRSPEFLCCIEQRGSLALSFSDWLKVGTVGLLEQAIASWRRIVCQPGPGQLQARAICVELSEGTLALWQQLRAKIGAKPAETLAKGLRFPRPRLGPKKVQVLIAPGEQGPVASECSTEIAALVAFAALPRSREELLQKLQELGAEVSEAAEILESLMDLLVEG